MKKKSEAQVLDEIDLEFNLGPNKLYPNHSGVAEYYGQRVKYGVLSVEVGPKELWEKAPDRIGYHQVLITPEMVGHTMPVFFVIEGKKEGGIGKDDRQPAQQRAIDRVVRAGGIGGIADSVEAVREIIANWYRRFQSGKEKNNSGRAGRSLLGGAYRKGDNCPECLRPFGFHKHGCKRSHIGG